MKRDVVVCGLGARAYGASILVINYGEQTLSYLLGDSGFVGENFSLCRNNTEDKPGNFLSGPNVTFSK